MTYGRNIRSVLQEKARELKLTAATASYYNGAHSGVKEVETHRKNPTRQTHQPLQKGYGQRVFFLLLQAVDKLHGSKIVF